MSNSEVFRPWSGFFMAGIVFLISAILSFQILLEGNAHDSVRAIAWAGAASCLAYLIFVRPKVTIFDEGITITNPFVEFTVGWARVEEVDARYSMSILIGEREIYAWAAPAPGRYHARSVHSSEVRGLNLGANNLIRPGESPRTHSGVATQLARLRLEKFRQSSNAQDIESQVIFNSAGAIVLVATLSAGLLLNFIHF